MGNNSTNPKYRNLYPLKLPAGPPVLPGLRTFVLSFLCSRINFIFSIFALSNSVTVCFLLLLRSINLRLDSGLFGHWFRLSHFTYQGPIKR
ncbi:hypothetical protein Patl1_11505 [Pistacia atlantica]|uniref:Uncharacterized protein n=1 Tax=Pistacia atlantica TaxID=434234 RepID=A0ACC1A807_9ROSI|nr:hypothetical protein Patl1_11505 [Pistacia atlantica]